MKTTKHLLAVAVASTAFSSSGFAVESLGDALKEGEVEISFRLRYEDVEVGDNDFDLTSLKTRLTYKTAELEGFSALVEMDDVTHIGDFEGGVLDPEGTEVNQAYVAYTAGATTVKFGRQRILLDNQRFVGGVGFRQNEQTYDAVSITNASLPDTTVFLANINNVNRIFGEDNPTGDHENDTYLLNIAYGGLGIGTLTGYAYLIDNEDAAAFSTDTYGLRFAGQAAGGNLKYTLEYAMQSDAADNPRNYDADYYLLDASYKVGAFTLNAGYEVLGADSSDGQFITPLATLHKFQGWADVFLGGGTGNVTGGIEDIYLSAATDIAGVKFSLVYHELGADDSGAAGTDDYGSEYGFVVAKAFGPLNLSVKYSDFSDDSSGTSVNNFSDTSKLWITAEAKF